MEAAIQLYIELLLVVGCKWNVIRRPRGAGPGVSGEMKGGGPASCARAECAPTKKHHHDNAAPHTYTRYVSKLSESGRDGHSQTSRRPPSGINYPELVSNRFEETRVLRSAALSRGSLLASANTEHCLVQRPQCADPTGSPIQPPIAAHCKRLSTESDGISVINPISWILT